MWRVTRSNEELRKVWTDVVGWVPTVLDLGLIRFFSTVRAANMQLAQDQRIRVWLGEPAIDWMTIKTREDFHALLGSRDTHAPKIVIDEILSQDKKALVIYGTGHFQRGFAGQSLLDLIEIDFPGSLFLIVPYVGFVDAACTIAFEAQFDSWPAPALVSPIKGTTLEDVLRLPEFRVLDLGSIDEMQEPSEAQLARLESVAAGLTADALLYLGPATSLITSPIDPSIYLDLDFLKEISRRSELQIGKAISLSDALNMATTMPRQIRHLSLSLAVSP